MRVWHAKWSNPLVDKFASFMLIVFTIIGQLKIMKMPFVLSMIYWLQHNLMSVGGTIRESEIPLFIRQPIKSISVLHRQTKTIITRFFLCYEKYVSLCLKIAEDVETERDGKHYTRFNHMWFKLIDWEGVHGLKIMRESCCTFLGRD